MIGSGFGSVVARPRTVRAQLKREIQDGTTTIEHAITDYPPQAAGMVISELLRCQPGWGPVRCTWFLARIGLSGSRSVMALTERQRRMLVRELAVERHL